MKILTSKNFNMIEMALAIGILAIGAICVVSMLPVGVRENRISAGENYSAHAADSIQAYISRIASTPTGWTEIVDASTPIIPNSKPSVSSSSTMNPADWGDKTSSNAKWLEGDIFQPDATPGIFAIRMQTSVESSKISNDFSGELLIWKKSINNFYFGGSKYSPTTNEALGINMEISWPAEVAYSKREKRNYYFEVYNANQSSTGGASGGGSGIPLPITVNGGKIEIPVPVTVGLNVLGSAIPCSVYMRVKYTEPQGASTKTTTYYPFGKTGSHYNPVTAGTTWALDSVANSSFTIDATIYQNFGYFFNSNANQQQIVILKDGDIPPVYEPYGSQPGIEAFLAPYMNASTKEINIDSNQVIILFELWTTNQNDSTFDMQDLVLLGTFVPK